MNKITLLVLVVLAGCAAPYQPEPTLLDPAVKQSVNIDPRLLKECDPTLKTLDDRAYPEKDVVAQTGIWSSQYSECRDNHKGLIDVVRKAFNLPTETKGSK